MPCHPSEPTSRLGLRPQFNPTRRFTPTRSRRILKDFGHTDAPIISLGLGALHDLRLDAEGDSLLGIVQARATGPAFHSVRKAHGVANLAVGHLGRIRVAL